MESTEFVHGGGELVAEKRHNEPKTSDNFTIDDLLDLPNDDECLVGNNICDAAAGNSTDCSTVTVVESCNSSFSGSEPLLLGDISGKELNDPRLSGDLCVPYDDLAELEWLSNFVEDSFKSEGAQKVQLDAGMKAPTEEVAETRNVCGDACQMQAVLRPEMSVPGKARSKRSRTAPGSWSSRIVVLSPTTSSSESDIGNSSRHAARSGSKKQETSEAGAGDGRKCLHCATDRTPQWRTGPMGPKTLCNACGVRYKSGRLVPEYRPAASPTFVLTKHSNSHRKVLELRRQKEMRVSQQQQFLYPNPVFDVVSSAGDDYLIHHVEPVFRLLI